jgi:hypothetical protein
MKTDDLISMLATGVEPVNAGLVKKRFQRALLVGVVGSFIVMLAGYGLRQDWATAVLLPMFWFKLAFPLALAIPALVLTARLGHPGMQLGRVWLALPLPWLVLTGLALVVLMNTPPQDRLALVLGSTWLSCMFNIALVSLPSFIALFWALQSLAPTRPALTGACAGLLAASLGAMVYALHCPEMEAPFLAVWYVLGLSIPTVAGALLGLRLLRW